MQKRRSKKKKNNTSKSTELVTITNSFVELPTDVIPSTSKQAKTLKQNIKSKQPTPSMAMDRTAATSNNEAEINVSPPKQVPSAPKRPPPIMMTGVTDFKKIHEILKNKIKGEYSLKLSNNNVYKLNTREVEDYRNTTKILNENNIPWYSFENKQTSQIRVMIKGLHHSCNPELIVEDLQLQNFKAVNAISKYKWKTKEPLDMFLVFFEADEDIKKIYNIKYILNTVVKVEPVKATNIIPQCKKCQSFGHTKNYCNRSPRCVKCPKKHPTSECDRLSTDVLKCCNCGENHPASYRGCTIAKELQKRRNIALRASKSKVINRITTPSRNLHATRPDISSNFSTERKTYSAVLTQQHLPQRTPQSHSNTSGLLTQILHKLSENENMSKLLLQRLERMENITYSFAAAHDKNY